MVRLSANSEQRDALNVLAATRRELTVEVRLDRLLRNAGGRRSRRRAMAPRRESADEQVADRLAELRRGQFRGPISVVMEIEVPPGDNQPSLPPVVKGYVDLLTDVVVSDDAKVEHLIVLRRIGTKPEAIVTLRCTPITVLADDYDRAFRIASELQPVPPDAPPTHIDGKRVPFDPSTWGLHDFGATDQELLRFDEQILTLIDDIDAEEAEQLAEDPDAPVDLDLSGSEVEFADPDVRRDTRTALEPRVAAGRAHWLANQSIGALDRPGPIPPWLTEVRDSDLADILDVDDSAPGCFLLPMPQARAGTLKNWIGQVTQVFAERLGEPEWRRTRFPAPMALDIALRGRAASFKDIDNRTWDIIKAFSHAFKATEPVLDGFRVYRLADADRDDIRVRLLPDARLRELARSLWRGRMFVAENRRERSKQLDPP